MNVCVLGAGTMGTGIAHVFAAKGNNVILWDVTSELAEKGLALIQANLNRLLQKEKISREQMDGILSNISISADISDAKGCSLFVEAVVEDMQIKKRLFKELDDIMDGDAVFASNTSSLSITEIANATKNPSRVVGMHFFNPAPVMKLVEVVKGYATSRETVEKILEIAKNIDKEGIVVQESSGFVVNRILIPMINEAISVLSEGIACAEDIDKAMKLGANHPIGPLALADLVGNDVILAIMDEMYKEIGDPKFRANPLLRKIVRAGFLGKKSGKGFYDY